MEPVGTPRTYSGRYELTHLIARGGMAQVYRAMDRQLERPVALKVLFPELSVDRTFVERFRREAQAAANLSHPNIVPVFDWGEDDGSYFIVMEYVEGRPLSAVLRDPQPMPPRQIATIGAGVAAALAFAHRHGVVHRDVKPGNVLITPDGDVKVTDFGIARAMNTEESLTQTGAVMGTAAYFSPEQAEGKGVDSRSDIYSLGVVLYEMAVGRPPFTGDSPVAVASKHVRDMPVLPREANPTVPPALEAVIMKAMAKDPDDRYGSAEELRADLLRFADGRPVEAADPGLTSVMTAAVAATQAVPMATGRTMAIPAGAAMAPSREDEERKKRTRNLIIMLVVLLVALAIIAFFLLRSVGVFGGNVTVPNVVGLTASQATQTLHNDNLTVGTSTVRASSTTKGEVLSTDPKSGASVSKNSAVNLVVSGGPNIPTVEVPTVTGKQLTQAIALLQAANLGYTIHNVTSNQSVGTVLSQDPAGGTKTLETHKVTLTVSGTQSTVAVPSVVGQSPARAGSILTQANLTVGSQTTACSGQPNGVVSAQSPASGANVPPNTPVNLVVSTGNCVSVPGVVGQSQNSATSAITGAGLVANTTFDTSCAGGAQPGNVDSQTPAAGAQVNSGTTVNISVCQSATTTTVPPPTTTTSSSTPAPPGPPGP
jgi:beta-lactam-binding protein with PASTA domain/tRNA A-37 threonylcarbamoyl transferase component Bud32